jgi:hypothetical protein
MTSSHLNDHSYLRSHVRMQFNYRLIRPKFINERVSNSQKNLFIPYIDKMQKE